ncbi:MAG: cation:proton antiporter [Candidatus Aenigmarchaeota archaeon]|nr:cation:proton antiporter [Candidatus Aenigmarchaeota archaeon]MDI6722439.1 cation:proton antiporter [Candidatus Aenigmarchaeota archaeon]
MPSILLEIAIILIFAKIFGEITQRLKLSSIVGEVLAGVVIGSLFHFRPDHFLEIIAGIGILLLVFLIGLQTKFEEIRSDIYRGSLLAILGSVLTFIGGIILGDIIFGSLNTGIVIGVAMVSTSTAIPIKALIDRGQIRTPAGKILVIIAVADDIIAILALSLMSTYFSGTAINIWNIVVLFLVMLGFIFFTLTAGSKAVEKIISFVGYHIKDEQALITAPIAVALATAALSQRLDIAAVTGAFVAGMIMSKGVFTKSIIIPKLETIGFGFFIPIFFAYSGMLMDLSSINQTWWIITALLIVGSATKMVGSGLFSRIFGYNAREQAVIAISMVPRGEYGIVISQLALAMGIISSDVYTILLSFVVVTIIITPFLFRLEEKMFSRNVVYKREKSESYR